MTYKVHNVLQSSFLLVQLVTETFHFIQKDIAFSHQKFCTFFSVHFAYAIHSGVGCIFDEINMFCIMIKKRDVVKVMNSDNMKLSSNRHSRSHDHDAFLSTSQDIFHQSQERPTSEQICSYKFSKASSHAYIVCHMNVKRTRVGSCDFWNMLCQWMLRPGGWIRE